MHSAIFRGNKKVRLSWVKKTVRKEKFHLKGDRDSLSYTHLQTHRYKSNSNGTAVAMDTKKKEMSRRGVGFLPFNQMSS